MRIERYRADSMQDALRQVRDELGADAVILNTRTVPSKVRWLGRDGVEVVAALSEKDAGGGEQGKGRVGERESGRKSGPAATRRPEAYSGGNGEVARPFPHSPIPPLDASAAGSLLPSLATDIREIREGLANLTTLLTPRVSASDAITARLVDAGMSLEMARELAARAKGVKRAQAWGAVRAAIAGRVAVSGPIDVSAGRAVVALVGPTGCGKTTTIAKLAAHYAIREKKAVALVSLDTYRVGALEQLRIFAQMLDVPLEAPLSLEEIPAAMERHEDKDLVLVDTVGHGPNDETRLRELAALLEKAQPDQVHLLLAAPTSRQALAATTDGFSCLNPTHLLLTKLDEMPSPGAAVETVMRAQKPVSYLSYGQEVPDDITLASAERLACGICAEEPK